MENRSLKGALIFASFAVLSTVSFVNTHSQPVTQSTRTQFETRCGWLDNPTPANSWLLDREARWILGTQGGYQLADSDWDKLPDFKPGQFVRTNVGSYGYGCACLRLRVNKTTHEVIEVQSGRARPLSACRRDRALKRWGFK